MVHFLRGFGDPSATACISEQLCDRRTFGRRVRKERSMAGMEGAEFLVAVTLCFGGVGGEKVAQQKVIPPKRTAKGDGLHVESGWRAFTEVEASRNTCLAKCLVTQGTELTRQCRRSRKTVQAQHDVHDGFRVHAHNSRAANVLDTQRFD